MRRRASVTLLLAAITHPLAAHAQLSGRMRQIGILMAFAESDPAARLWVNVFLQGLKDLNWTDSNAKFDLRWANSDVATMAALAKDIIAHQPDVVLASSSPVLAALQRETSTVPLVFVNVSNPVGAGFVRSLAQPGGNTTGLANAEGEMAGKWLTYLREISPTMNRVGVLLHLDAAAHEVFWRVVSALSSPMGVRPVALPFRSAADIEHNLNAFAVEPHGGLLVLPNNIAIANRGLITKLAAHHRMPAIYPFRVFATDGGLMAYGNDLIDSHYRAATFVAKVLDGTAPAELPVQLQTKFALSINMKTAAELGVTVPMSLLASADEVIE